MPRTAKYEVREAKDRSGFYYVLIASNSEVLSTSELYASRGDANRGVADALKANEGAHGFDLDEE